MSKLARCLIELFFLFSVFVFLFGGRECLEYVQLHQVLKDDWSMVAFKFSFMSKSFTCVSKSSVPSFSFITIFTILITFCMDLEAMI